MLRMSGILMACSVLVGCGGQSRGDIRGTVTYKGRPVAHAIVMVIAADQQVYRADTDASGNYSVSGVPYGTARVAVQRPMRESEGPPLDDHRNAPGAPTGPGKNRSRVPTIPGRYADPATSNLTVDLADNDHQFDIAMN